MKETVNQKEENLWKVSPFQHQNILRLTIDIQISLGMHGFLQAIPRCSMYIQIIYNYTHSRYWIWFQLLRHKNPINQEYFWDIQQHSPSCILNWLNRVHDMRRSECNHTTFWATEIVLFLFPKNKPWPSTHLASFLSYLEHYPTMKTWNTGAS